MMSKGRRWLDDKEGKIKGLVCVCCRWLFYRLIAWCLFIYLVSLTHQRFAFMMNSRHHACN